MSGSRPRGRPLIESRITAHRGFVERSGVTVHACPTHPGPGIVNQPLLSTAVVIPYFQRKPGLLDACVRSVLAQQGVPPCRVIVVDDGSPLPAHQELAPLLAEHPNLTVVRQQNAGPGAARNRGIESVEPATELVAFLDSDDCWHEGFLADAQLAFGHGCDMFFANTQRFGAEHTRFEWKHASGRRLDLSAHTVYDKERGIYGFNGDFFDFALHRSAVISTSTLIYRFRKHPGLRFDETLFNGQDRFFKLQLSKAASNVGFSTRVCAIEGQGINIFDSSQWGSEKSLNLAVSYVKLSRLILRRIELDPRQDAHTRTLLAQSRYDLASTVLHLLRSGKKINLELLRGAFAADPASAGLFVPNLLRAAVRKLAPDNKELRP